MEVPPSTPGTLSTPRQAARRGQTDQKILDAVLAIVRRSGLTSVTIDAVAAQSGVAKTTIYRRYADRFELMSGVAGQLSRGALRDHDHTKDGLAGLVRDVHHSFEEGLGLTAIGTLLRSEDDYIQEWRDSILTPGLDAMRDYFARGIDVGAFAAEIDYELIVETVVGGMVFCAAIRGEVPDYWTDRVTEMVWQHVHSPAMTDVMPKG